MRGLIHMAGRVAVAALLALAPTVLSAQETSVAESAVRISSRHVHRRRVQRRCVRRVLAGFPPPTAESERRGFQ